VHVTVRDAAAARAALPAWLAARGIVGGEIREITPSLEDVFVARVHDAGGAVEG